MLCFVLLGFTQFSFAQVNENSKPVQMTGSISVTNKGISLIPSFTLGKPAAVADFSVTKGRFSFDPTFRFALEKMKPWSFIFWFRYKVVDSDRFSFNIGAHPAYSFKYAESSESDLADDAIMVNRYLAGEIAPTFVLSDKISVGPYYLVAHGTGGDVNNYNHYIALRGGLSNIGLVGDVSFSLSPQVYYLNLDGVIGTYVATGVSLKKQTSPFSVSAMFNQTLDSDIGGDDFIWNISLVYSFNKKYNEQ